ncbi:MAG TPA: DUF4254 domain-containing protein [bacterium]|nr:DUF4254 domain-containing protein [bacterium]
MFNAEKLINLFDKLIKNWHSQNKIKLTNNTKNELENLVIKLLFHNYTLWHLEDEARAVDVSDEIIANVKRKIDKENQLRNDTIEIIDIYIFNELANKKIKPKKNSYSPTETLGAALDRLTIISLKIYHMALETLRKNAAADHKKKCSDKLKILKIQRVDLAQAINTTLEKILKGELIHKIYRQMKMYNDPTLNPILYKKKSKRK